MKTYYKLKDLLIDTLNGKIPMGIAAEYMAPMLHYERSSEDSSVGYREANEIPFVEVLEAAPRFDDIQVNVGGLFLVCETEEDLTLIQTLELRSDEQGNAKYRNVTETVTGQWDTVAYLLNDKSTGWGYLLLCTNNSGGNTYFVPEKLWQACHFEEHLRAYHADYSNVNPQR